MIQAIGGDESDFLWAVFGMLVVNGVTMALQTARVGPVGSGLIVATYPSAIAIPFCIIALQKGGPAALLALMVVSALAQILISLRLSLLRRIVTPTVSGTIMMLLIIIMVPVIFGNVTDVPDGAPAAAGPACIAATFVVTIVLLLRGVGQWRVWAPLLGIGAGSAVAVVFGIYDLEAARSALWGGFPLSGWPFLNLSADRDFWITFVALLPAFLFLAVIGVLTSSSIGISTQRVSWREARAMDYRRVRGGAICTGLGNALAGIICLSPMVTMTRGITFALQTGCASRRVGLLTGLVILAAAFFPKSWALLMGIPAPVTASFLVVIISPLFVEGIKMVAQDSPDFRKSIVVGAAVIIGLGFQSGLVALPIGELWGLMLSSGLIAGGIVLVLLTLLSECTGWRRNRLRTETSIDALPGINRFLADFAGARDWNPRLTRRMQAVAEEVLIILATPQAGTSGGAAHPSGWSCRSATAAPAQRWNSSARPPIRKNWKTGLRS